ncbi:MAG: hypothetical protein CVU61_11420 [Deltaproteobacteria bacterium HGW-Deltaproteobacteria-19]|jgi:c-di-GMP-binding flagellar brake protein YcgR|nr:MAG: hypothetical protein CVU61_11420 [Deltaproteobacteria bacterium HGW-Deltaproteobacteria-19]
MENESSSVELCPGVALEMPLQLTVEGIGTFKSLLIGAEHGRYLIVKMPHVPDLASKLYQKNHVIVRYLHAGRVFGFRATLIGAIKEPVRLFVLSYPESIESHNTRKNERFDCLIPASIHAEALPEEKGVKGFVNDMSMGGCRFQAKANSCSDLGKLSVGETINLSFRFLGEEAWQTLVMELRSLVVDNKQVMMGLSIKTGIETEPQRKAMAFIREIITSLQE